MSKQRKRPLKVSVVATEGSTKRDQPHFMRIKWGNGLKALHTQQHPSYWKALRAAEDFIEAVTLHKPLLDEEEAAPAQRRSRQTPVAEDGGERIQLEEIEPATCVKCGRKRGDLADDYLDYSPIQVATGQQLGWYSGEDAEMCPGCMSETLANQ